MTVERASMRPVTAIAPHSIAAWRVAIRPRSLLVAVSPVLAAASLGFARTGAIDRRITVLVFCAAVLMQIIVNLQNDVGYTVRGGERASPRIGLPRATANGWLGVGSVRAAIVVAALLAAGVGLALFAYRGLPVLVIGAASLGAALAYMGGPRPIAYTPFGEATVFVFFGIVAVIGTDWMVTGSVGAPTLPAAVSLGALAAAALAVNNHRDAAHDRLAGRRTFAVVNGAVASRRLFAALLIGAFAMLPAIAWLSRSPAPLLPLLAAPTALRLHGALAGAKHEAVLNDVLFRAFRLEMLFAVLLSIGALAGAMAR